MSTQMEKLLSQQAKAQQKLHKAEMDDKKIKKQIADLARNERIRQSMTGLLIVTISCLLSCRWNWN